MNEQSETMEQPVESVQRNDGSTAALLSGGSHEHGDITPGGSGNL